MTSPISSVQHQVQARSSKTTLQNLEVASVKSADKIAQSAPRRTTVTPLTLTPIGVSVITHTKPFSALGGKVVRATLQKAPVFGAWISKLGAMNNGATDLVTISGISLTAGGRPANFVQAEINLQQLANLPPDARRELLRVVALLPGMSAGQIAWLQEEARSAKWKNSDLMKNGSIRIVANIADPSQVIVTVRTPIAMKKLQRNKGEFIYFLETGVVFNAQNKAVGLTLFTGAAAVSKTNKQGFQGVLIGGVAGKVDLNTGASAFRRNAKGEIGVEVDFEGAPRFLALPSNVLSTIPGLKKLDKNNTQLSSTTSVTAEEFARVTLNTNDPAIVRKFEQAIETAEQGKNLLSGAEVLFNTATVAATIGQIANVPQANAAARSALPLALQLLRYGGATAAIWLALPQDSVASAMPQDYYAKAVREAEPARQRLSVALGKSGALTPAEYAQATRDVAELEERGQRMRKMDIVNKYEQSLPENRRFRVWNPESIKSLRHALTEKQSGAASTANSLPSQTSYPNSGSRPQATTVKPRTSAEGLFGEGSATASSANVEMPYGTAPRATYRTEGALMRALSARDNAATAYVDGAFAVNELMRKDFNTYLQLTALPPGKSYTFNQISVGSNDQVPIVVTVTGTSSDAAKRGGTLAITVRSPYGVVTMHAKTGGTTASPLLINDLVRKLKTLRGADVSSTSASAQASASSKPADRKTPAGALAVSQQELVASLPPGARDDIVFANMQFANGTTIATQNQPRTGQQIWASVRNGESQSFRYVITHKPGEKPKHGVWGVVSNTRNPETYWLFVKKTNGDWVKSSFSATRESERRSIGALNLYPAFGAKPKKV